MNALAAVQVVKVLEKMAELELAIAELYRTCGEVWTDEAALWLSIAQAEVQHAEQIGKIAGLLQKNPQAFEIGRPLSIVAVQTAIAGVRSYMERLKKGELKRKQALFILRDTEQSLLESKYAEMLKSSDREYNHLAMEIVSQTEAHRKLLNGKIEASKESL